MVHVRKCPLGHRGRPTTEFYKDGKPQIYCLGWLDSMTDEPLEECSSCKDFVYAAQADLEKDLAKMIGAEEGSVDYDPSHPFADDVMMGGAEEGANNAPENG